MNTFLRETKQLLVYALPNILAQVIRMLTNVFATFFVGHLTVTALAANGLVSSYFITTALFSIGCLFSVSVVAGRAFGAKDQTKLRETIVAGLWVAFFVAIPTAILVDIGPWVLLCFHQSPELVAQTHLYFHCLALTTFFMLWNVVLQQFFLATGKIRLNYCVTALNLILSIVFFELFVEGHAISLGVSGVGLSFLLAGILTTVVSATILCLHRDTKALDLWHSWYRVSFSAVKKLFSIGWPIGASMLVELAAIFVMVIFIGWFGHISLAAYQVVWQWLLLGIMIGLGIGQALAVLIGQSIGSKQPERLHLIVKSGLVLSIVLTMVMSIIYWLFPEELVRFFLQPNEVDVTAVVALATHMLCLTAFFQLFDCQRVTSQGALRAFHDVRMPLLYSMIAYWLIALPLGAFLAFVCHLETIGFWIGLGVADLFGAILITRRLLRFSRQSSDGIVPGIV